MPREFYFIRNTDGGYGVPAGFAPASGAIKPGGQFYDFYIGPDNQRYQTYFGSNNNPAEGNSPASRLVPMGVTPGENLFTSGKYRDIGNIPVGQSVLDVLGPQFDPAKGPQVDTGQGRKTFDPNSKGSGYNPSGQGFYTPEITKNNPVQPSETVKNIILNTQNVLAQFQALGGTLTPGMKASAAAIGIPSLPATIDTTKVTSLPSSPSLPSPSAPASSVSYIGGVAQDVLTARAALESRYQTELNSLRQKQAEAQARIDNLGAKEQNIIEGPVQTLLAPWRQQLENSERARLKVEENYFKNLDSVSELETLLTEGNSLIDEMKSTTGLASIRNPRIQEAIDDVNSRAGVIQAVMAARNNQISVAEGLIDRTMKAIGADKQDQLNYWNTLLTFYEGQRSDGRTTLSNLSKDEREYVGAQISLLQNDLAEKQETATYIKSLMVNPATADQVERAGVTLNDSIATIQQKFAKLGYTDEVKDLNNTFAASGYKFVTPAEAATKPVGEVVTVTDSRGQSYSYWKESTKNTSVVEVNGRKILIDNQTGQTLKVLGASGAMPGGSASSAPPGSSAAGVAPTALTNAFNNAALSLTNQQRETATAQFNALVKQGDLTSIKEFLVRVATAGSPVDQQNQAIGRQQAIDSMQYIAQLLAQAKAKGAPTNIVTGNLENAAQKLGATTNPDFAYIGNQIAQSLQVYRRAMTGVAFNPGESAEYAKIFPSITDISTLNTAKIDSLLDSFNRNQRTFLGFTMGTSNYDAIFGKPQLLGATGREAALASDLSALSNADFFNSIVPTKPSPANAPPPKNSVFEDLNFEGFDPFGKLFSFFK